jgi:hypothetical protein
MDYISFLVVMVYCLTFTGKTSMNYENDLDESRPYTKLFLHLPNFRIFFLGFPTHFRTLIDY